MHSVIFLRPALFLCLCFLSQVSKWQFLEVISLLSLPSFCLTTPSFQPACFDKFKCVLFCLWMVLQRVYITQTCVFTSGTSTKIATSGCKSKMVWAAVMGNSMWLNDSDFNLFALSPSAEWWQHNSYHWALCRFRAPLKFALEGGKAGNFTRSPFHTEVSSFSNKNTSNNICQSH